MKKLFVAAAIVALTTGSAFAADIAARPYAKAPAYTAVYDWTGFYLGVNAGVGFGRSRSEVIESGLLSNLGGAEAIGGAQIGYNRQLGNIVLGVEADIQGSSMRDDRTCQFCHRELSFDQKLDWFGTVRGRIGYADGPVLSYITGGFAYGGAKTSVNLGDENNSQFSGLAGGTKTGWTVGSGIEAALGGNWTGKIEYLYLDLGQQNGFVFPMTGFLPFTSEIREHIFRAGLNYRIGGVGLAAPQPVADWTGFYVGGNVGSATALNPSDHISLFNGAPNIEEKFNLSPEGYLGGVQVGHNWQVSRWVYGLEADIQGSTQKDDTPCMTECLSNQFSRFDQHMRWLGTARARLGYSVGSTLFYGTGGLAFGGITTRVTEVLNGGVVNEKFSHTNAGWTVGGGVESPFNPFGLFGKHWTSKTEYLYVDLGTVSDTYAFAVNGGATRTDTVSSRIHEHIFRTGLNYHFNSPVVARY